MSGRSAQRRNGPYVSSELAHFVGREKPTDEARYNVLREIIESGILRPSGPADAVSVRLPLFGAMPAFSKETLSRVPAVCFCDIPRRALSIHVRKFGPFGLAFYKELLVRRGANRLSPVIVGVRGELDDARPEHIQGLKRVAEHFIKENHKQLGRIAAALKQPRL